MAARSFDRLRAQGLTLRRCVDVQRLLECRSELVVHHRGVSLCLRSCSARVYITARPPGRVVVCARWLIHSLGPLQ